MTGTHRALVGADPTANAADLFPHNPEVFCLCGDALAFMRDVVSRAPFGPEPAPRDPLRRINGSPAPVLRAWTYSLGLIRGGPGRPVSGS
jgi:hypothetical protein